MTPTTTKTLCQDCGGTKVRRDPLPGSPGQWVERVCALCQGRGWLDLHEATLLREQGIWRDRRGGAGP